MTNDGMTIGDAIAWFFAGAFLANAVPHLVTGITGRPFQSPFATPPGIGLSSSTINVLWGFANLIAGWALATQVGTIDPRRLADAAPLLVGVLAMSLFAARHFGRLHGGTTPPR